MERHRGQPDRDSAERDDRDVHGGVWPGPDDAHNREHAAADSDKSTKSAKGNQPSLLSRWRKVSLPNKLTVTCTAVIAIATVLYTCFAFRQWEVMSAQLDQMKGGSAQTSSLIAETHTLAQATKDIAEAARSQAAATSQTAESALNASRAALAANSLTAGSLRARIERRSTQIDKPITAGQGVSAILYFENVGHSAAYNLRVKTGIKHWVGMPEGPMPVRMPDQGETLEVGPPGHYLYMVDPEPATGDFLAGLPVKLGDTTRETAYFFGRFEYLTLGMPHYTEFCFYITRSPIPDYPFVIQTVEKRYTLMQCSRWHASN